jgi:hypothetical protein
MNLLLLLSCLVMEYQSPEKKTANCIIARSLWCKVSVIFFPGDNSVTKQNKFTFYHLIISKHKYYVIKPFIYMFHDFFLHYILWHLIIQRCLATCVTYRFFLVTQNDHDISTNRKACYKELRNEAYNFFSSSRYAKHIDEKVVRPIFPS